MFKLTPNLEPEGKYTRIVVGAILIIGSIIGWGRIFLFIVGAVLIAEGIIGWGGVPVLMEKFLNKPKGPGSPQS